MDKSKNDLDNNRTEKRNLVDDLASEDDLDKENNEKGGWVILLLHISVACLGDADFKNNTAVITGLNGNRLEIVGEKDGDRDVAAIIDSIREKY